MICRKFRNGWTSRRNSPFEKASVDLFKMGSTCHRADTLIRPDAFRYRHREVSVHRRQMRFTYCLLVGLLMRALRE